MKIALVHDFLKEYGGAERVLEALREMWPTAPVYTAFVDYKGLGPHAQRIKKWDIRPSWVQKNWLVKKLHSPLRFLAPKIWKSFSLENYDVIITSSSWFMTKGIVKSKGAIHICYLHSVPRYLYGYETKMNWQKHFLTRWYGNIVNHYLRMYDFKTSQEVDYFIANSMETARRIKKFYRRDSTVIYPPVELREVQSAKCKAPSFAKSFGRAQQIQVQNLETKDERLKTGDKNYYLCVSRLASAKHIDVAIKAANKMKFSLYVVGKGPEEKYLKSIAGQTVRFFGEVTDSQLIDLYANCKAFIFCAKDEDFGIVPVEAMGFGKPVIAYKSGGVAETVIDGKTGVLFEELTEEGLIGAIRRYEDTLNQNKFGSGQVNILSEDCVEQAQKFAKERFVEKMRGFVEEKHNHDKKLYKKNTELLDCGIGDFKVE